MNKSEFKILVAEDDEMVRDVIVKFLREEGHTVIVADDGLKAIKFLRVEDIKLVLTDLRMPGADGMEVLRTAIQINPKISVVLLTAYGTLDTALEAMNEGAYDYIVKPFVMQQLLLVVKNAFKMANLIEENEKLSYEIKEMYHKLKDADKHERIDAEHESSDAAFLIEKLIEIGVIDSTEAKNLIQKITNKSDKDKIKKYSDLINRLK